MKLRLRLKEIASMQKQQNMRDRGSLQKMRKWNVSDQKPKRLRARLQLNRRDKDQRLMRRESDQKKRQSITLNIRKIQTHIQKQQLRQSTTKRLKSRQQLPPLMKKSPESLMSLTQVMKQGSSLQQTERERPKLKNMTSKENLKKKNKLPLNNQLPKNQSKLNMLPTRLNFHSRLQVTLKVRSTLRREVEFKHLLNLLPQTSTLLHPYQANQQRGQF